MSDRATGGVHADVSVIRASGLFDEDFYTTRNPQGVPAGADPLVHFCTDGWRNLLNPSADFDVWWYWSNHLDPAQDTINPLVHYIEAGRGAGLTGKPVDTRTRVSATLPEDDQPRRICLFAGFDRDGVVDGYVIEYLRKLRRFARVFCLFDCELPPEELAKLRRVTSNAWAIRHGAYDFGSYSILARDLVGWDAIRDCDELLLVNDSCYPLDDFDDVFAEMDGRDCAWWGLQATKGIAMTQKKARREITEPIPLPTVRSEMLDRFEDDAFYDFLVGSYFLAFRRPVLEDAGFRRLLDSVHQQTNKLQIIQKYEIGLTRYLIGNGYGIDTFIDALHPFHPVFTERFWTLLDQGFPLLKKYFLYQNHYDTPGLKDWKQQVRARFPDAEVDRFERNLMRTAPHDRLVRSFAIKRDEHGTVTVPKIRRSAALLRRDAEVPTFDHWWAFPVSYDLHRLPEASRAIFEEVRHDPSIRKIVLTRSRRVHLPGENVVLAPLESPGGQYCLMRAGQVFVNEEHTRALPQAVSWNAHNLFLVRNGLALQKADSALGPPPPRVTPDKAVRGLLTSSDTDQLAALAAAWRAGYEDCWRTGLPALDYLCAPEGSLPVDQQAQVDRLQDALDGRRLVLFAPGRGRSEPGVAYEFSPAQVDWLADWAQRNDAVLGLREDPQVHGHAYLRQLGPYVLDLAMARYPSTSVLLRSVDALVTDVSGVGLDFIATGRPVLNFVHDLAEVSDSLYYDLELVAPAPVCAGFDDLAGQLEQVFETPSDAQQRRYQRSRRMFFDRIDASAAHRAVQRVRAGYVEEVPA